MSAHDEDFGARIVLIAVSAALLLALIGVIWQL
jgi:hypothetical protein